MSLSTAAASVGSLFHARGAATENAVCVVFTRCYKTGPLVTVGQKMPLSSQGKCSDAFMCGGICDDDFVAELLLS